jgi:hypothetical protein
MVSAKQVLHMLRPLQTLSLFVSTLFLHSSSAAAAPQANSGVSAPPSVVVIGFVGGFVRHTDRVHSEVQLAEHLRRDFPSGVTVEMFENHRGKEAHQRVLELLDIDGDGELSRAEKESARIIIYGHSWGASETVNLARQLEKDGIPVLLTIQVDSISKGGQNDTIIPANVVQAANFYQRNGLLHGAPAIHSADPARTRIIGNFRFDYSAKPLRCEQYPWFSRTFMKSHIQIECDPAVWNQVESLVRSSLLPAPTNASGQSFQRVDSSIANTAPHNR